MEEVQSGHPEKRYHSHTFSELVLVLHGEARHIIGSESCTVSRGDILVLHPGFAHCYDKTGDFGIINLTYDHRRLSMPLMDSHELPLFRRFFPSDETVFTEKELCLPVGTLPGELLDEFADGIRALGRELESAQPGNFYISTGMFMNIMGRLARTAEGKQEDHRTVYRIGGVIEYMYQNLKEPMNIDDLARKSGLSRRSFFRVFKTMTGSTPQEYRSQIRLKQASEMLRLTDLNISEIAAQCGFYDSNHFCHVFKKKFQLSPRQFRLKNQPPIQNLS